MTTSMGSFKCWIYIKNLHKLYIWPIYVFHSQLNIPVDAGVSLHGRFMIRYRVQFLLLATYRLPMFSLKCMCTSCIKKKASMFSIHSTRHMPSAISTVPCKILVQCLFPNYGNYIKKNNHLFFIQTRYAVPNMVTAKTLVRWYGVEWQALCPNLRSCDRDSYLAFATRQSDRTVSLMQLANWHLVNAAVIFK